MIFKSIPGTINEKTRRNTISFTIKKWAGSPNQDKEIEKKKQELLELEEKQMSLFAMT